jgi:hypothetical protein
MVGQNFEYADGILSLVNESRMIQPDYVHQAFSLRVEGRHCAVRFNAQTFAVGDFTGVWNTIGEFLLVTKLAGKNQVVIFAFEVRCFIL